MLLWLISLNFESTENHGHLLIIVTKLTIKLIIIGIIKQCDPLLKMLVVLVFCDRFEVLNIE